MTFRALGRPEDALDHVPELPQDQLDKGLHLPTYLKIELPQDQLDKGLHLPTYLPTYLKIVIVTPAVYPGLVEFLHFDFQSTGQK